MVHPIKPQPGNADDLASFVGRVAVTEKALSMLRAGMNLSLSDPRRMGKTYWLRHLREQASDFDTVIIDYEGSGSLDDILTKTVAALRASTPIHTRVGKWLAGHFEGVEVITGPVRIKAGVAQESRVKLLADVLGKIGQDVDQKVLICMDEVPLALRNLSRSGHPEDANLLLQTLRQLRSDVPSIRWVLAGSIGFHHVLAECGATEGELNNLDPIHLGPLSGPEADELTVRLGEGIGRELDGSAVARMYERTTGIPYLIHQVAKQLDTGSRDPVVVGEIDEAIEDYIDDPDESRAYAHVLTRLEINFDTADVTIARRVLDFLAERAGAGASRADIHDSLDVTDVEQFTRVLALLTQDHYLQKKGRTYSWRYEALRYFWARRRDLVDRP